MKPLSLTAFMLLAGTIPATAQPTTFTAVKIQFNNPGPYSQAQLEAVAGMHSGMKFTVADLDAAAQRLADTSFFGDIRGTTAPGRVDAITVEFDLTPLDRSQMLHLTFENFVWLTHEEILAALQTKAPLCMGWSPSNNQLLDAFNDALTEALAKKGIQAKVQHDAFEPTLTRPEMDVDYWIASPSIRVANVKLEGVSTDLVPLIQKSVNSVAAKAYRGGLVGETTEDRILAPLLDAGYIDAALSGESVVLGGAGGTAQGGATQVVVVATLHAGDIYRISSISFAGNSMLSADAFAASVKLHTGDIASRAQLLATLKPLDAAYRRAGYADVIVRAEPKEDPATHQVAYTVTVTPGEQYRIKTVTPDGLDTAGEAAFDRGFTMKVGDLYNPEYLQGFLERNTALRGLEGYRFSYKAYADPNTHTVDLVLYFSRGGVQQNVTVFGGQ